MKISVFALFAGLVALATGCAHELVYLPVGPAASGGPAAQYPIPPGNPQGAVYVTSFGFTDLETGAPGGPVLHARLAVSNGSASVWAVDARFQQLVAPGQPARPPSFLNTDAGGAGPVYQIPPGRTNVFDLYFSVPAPLDQVGALDGFSLDWNVNAGSQPVAQATSFQRVDELATDWSDDYPPYVTVGLGFGIGWWGAPWYPYGGFAPHVRRYYYPPYGVHGGPWNGPHPPGWRAAPPVGGWAHAGGWRGGWHSAGGFHTAPRGSFHGGGARGGGFHGGGHR
jgi:hypothetical protein